MREIRKSGSTRGEGVAVQPSPSLLLYPLSTRSMLDPAFMFAAGATSYAAAAAGNSGIARISRMCSTCVVTWRAFPTSH